MVVLSSSTKIDVRKRLSLGSLEVQISHWQAITGTPCDVPVPKNVTFSTLILS
jgi:hypothetical protein